MEEEFYASIKLKHSGEEIFSKVTANDEGDRLLLHLNYPIVVEEIKVRGRTGGYLGRMYDVTMEFLTCIRFFMISIKCSEGIGMYIVYCAKVFAHRWYVFINCWSQNSKLFVIDY